VSVVDGQFSSIRRARRLEGGPLDDWDQGIADFAEIIGTNTPGSFLFGRAVAPTMVSDECGHVANVAADHILPHPSTRSRDTAKWTDPRDVVGPADLGR
jgi:NAD(P)-dependent dehydrogenase (short-subunit alcohol dehydrogenase family)